MSSTVVYISLYLVNFFHFKSALYLRKKGLEPFADGNDSEKQQSCNFTSYRLFISIFPILSQPSPLASVNLLFFYGPVLLHMRRLRGEAAYNETDIAHDRRYQSGTHNHMR